MRDMAPDNSAGRTCATNPQSPIYRQSLELRSDKARHPRKFSCRWMAWVNGSPSLPILALNLSISSSSMILIGLEASDPGELAPENTR